MHRRIGWRAGALLAALWVNPLMAADAMFPSGLRVGLVPPAGMVASKNFPGFEDRDRKVGILIVELPRGAYDDGVKAIFTDKPADQVVLEKREIFPFEDGVGFLAVGSERTDAAVHRKWFLLTHNSELTALVTAQVPDTARDA